MVVIKVFFSSEIYAVSSLIQKYPQEAVFYALN
jgi:hypothetical protein